MFLFDVRVLDKVNDDVVVTCRGGPLKVILLQGKFAEDIGPKKEENLNTNRKKYIVSYNSF